MKGVRRLYREVRSQNWAWIFAAVVLERGGKEAGHAVRRVRESVGSESREGVNHVGCCVGWLYTWDDSHFLYSSLIIRMLVPASIFKPKKVQKNTNNDLSMLNS